MKKIIDNIEKYFVVTLLPIMVAIVFIQVVFRLRGKSLPWSEEASRYIMVWATFVGASLGVKEGAHIGVEALTGILPKNIVKIISIATTLLSLVFSIIVIFYNTQLMSTQIEMGQISPAMQIPMWIPYSGLSVGFVLISFRLIQLLFKIIKGEKVENTSEPI